MIEPPATGPLGRWGYLAVPLGGERALMIGGATFDAFGAGAVIGDAWIWDASSGTPELTEVDPSSGPEPRYCGCAALDTTRNRVLVFGGRDSALATLTETWELDVASETWMPIAPAVSPTGGVGCALAYAPEVDTFFLFGGGATRSFVDETWTYAPESREWTRLEIAGPSARYDAVLRHVADGEPLLLFAGSLGAMAGSGFYRDVWRLHVDPPRWEEVPATGGPPPGRRVPWMVLDPDGGGFLAGLGVAGLQPTEALGDLWHFDLATATWTPIDAGPGPSPRGFAPALPGGPGAAGFLLGGTDNAEPKREVWRLERVVP